VLSRQRERWHLGLIGTVLTHRSLLFNPKYGATGMIAMPYFVFAEMLAPVVEALGLVLTIVGTALGLLEPVYAVAFFLVVYVYSTVLSLAAILMEEASFHRYKRPVDSLKLILFALIEPFGYRQLTMWFRLKAFVRFARGDHSWGKMPREGFAAPAVARGATATQTPQAAPTP
jgi:hypothetical protein